MSGLSTNVKTGHYREVLFWFLLLGSWQFLALPGGKTGIIGALGATAFVAFAWANVDRLRGLGLDHVRWRSAERPNWVIAGASGVLAGIVVFIIGCASGQNMRLGGNWKLIALRVTGAGARGGRVPRLSVRLPHVVNDQDADFWRLKLAGRPSRRDGLC